MSDDLPALWRDLSDQPQGAVARWLRRIAVTVMVLLVVAALLGLAGPTEKTVTDESGPDELSVTYPAVTRAGEPAPLRIEVTREGGFDGPITVTLCRPLFDLLDFQSWWPTPSAETAGPDELVYEFDPPDGDTLDVRLDARSAPGPFGEVSACEVAVEVKGATTASVTFDVRRMP